MGDFDGDGDLDLAVTNAASNDVTIVLNQSSDEEDPPPGGKEPRPGGEEPATADGAPFAAETRGVRPLAARDRAVFRRTRLFHRGDFVRQVARSGDSTHAGGAEVGLARTGLPLALLALIGSFLFGAGARLRRPVGGREV